MYKLSIGEQNEVLKAARNGHYHVACTRLFEIQHKIKNGEGLGKGQSVDHPNRYFDESRKIIRAAEGDVKAEPGLKVKADPGAVTAEQTDGSVKMEVDN